MEMEDEVGGANASFSVSSFLVLCARCRAILLKPTEAQSFGNKLNLL